MGLFTTKVKTSRATLPALILDDVVCYPHGVVPLFISLKPGMAAVDNAMANDRQILIIYKYKDQSKAGRDSFADYASLCKINQVMRLPNNSARVVVEAEKRVRLLEVLEGSGSPQGTWDELALDNTIDQEIGRWMRNLVETFRRYAVLQKKVPAEVLQACELADNPHKLIDLSCGASHLPYDKKLELFSMVDTNLRLQEASVLLESEIYLLELKADVNNRVKKRMETSQKEYFVNEQIKELNREIGKEEDDASGVKELEAKLQKLTLPPEVAERTKAELKRLTRLSPLTPEAGIVRTYLELIAELPWGPEPEASFNITQASTILDQDHYDLAEAKDRILDYLAARQINPNVKNPILCFVGPPGTGKTSLGRSIARALERSFVRISLGGVRDEAEIRGHRKTYVGALPGKILQGMKKAKSIKPVFLLDEIDKLASDHRGDPAAALLEVLDPEQNHTFSDHYLELTYDLSKVLFIATANNLGTIPAPLRDRMEIVEIPGYTPYEKQRIATDFIIPKQLNEHGVSKKITFTPEAISTIIELYTNEAGVRHLDRNIVKCIRKTLRENLDVLKDQNQTTTSPENHQGDENPNPAPEQPEVSLVITQEKVQNFLKKPRPLQNVLYENLPPGLAYGLAWTETGGTVLPVEVSLSPGKGDFILTGSLGDVMKESARIALSLIRSKGLYKQNEIDDFSTFDIHLHVPEGAIPKDGPSAGITLTTAILSALLSKGIKGRVAMTGEITLTGRVLAIGGLREKVLAAHRLGFTTIILPLANKQDALELPDEVKDVITLIYASTIDDVLDGVFDKDQAIA